MVFGFLTFHVSVKNILLPYSNFIYQVQKCKSPPTMVWTFCQKRLHYQFLTEFGSIKKLNFSDMAVVGSWYWNLYFLKHADQFQTKKLSTDITRASRTTGAKGNNLFVSNSKLNISSIRYQVSDIKYQISSIGYQASDIKYQVSSIG